MYFSSFQTMQRNCGMMKEQQSNFQEKFTNVKLPIYVHQGGVMPSPMNPPKQNLEGLQKLPFIHCKLGPPAGLDYKRQRSPIS